jgi:LuxR family transcriptional regulator, maltose regulon positive regulatory protein
VQRIEPQRSARLPLLGAEYRSGQPAFARHFFESLQELLPAQAVVVLDNYQDVGAHAALHAFLAQGSAALAPAGLRLLCLSRGSPPAELLQRSAATGAAVIDWDALRLTFDETAALAQLRAGAASAPGAAALERMHRHAQGWAAGLMLLLESPDALAGTRMQRSDQATFDYFAAEVLQRMDPLLHDLLPPLALAPAVSHAMATQLTGNANAGRHLDELVRTHGFTTRHDSGHYQFHPLFRNFLLDRLRRGSSRAHLEDLQRGTARLLAEEGLPEEAAHLFIEAADWAGLAGLIARSAGAMLAQGRHEALAAWLGALPAALRDADPWLLLHAGAASLVSDLDASRALFERALARFGEAGQDDAAGLALAWASLTQAIALQWSDFSPLARWTEFAQERIVPRMAQLAPELQGRVVLGMFIALVFHQPQHRALGAWAERLEAVASHCPDASDRLELAAYLLLYRLIWLGDLHGAERLIDAHRAQRQAASLRVGACIHWDFSHAIRSWLRNENGAALATLDGAIQLARTRGVPSLEFMLHAGGVYASMNAQDTASAARHLAQAGSRTAASRPIELAHHQLLSAWLERVQGNASAARRRCEWAHATLAARGGPFEMLRVHLELAQALRMCGEHRAALEHGEQGLALARSMGNRWMEHVALACLAEAAFAGGDRARGLASLRAAYALAREQGYRSLIWQDPKSMALLCAQALQAYIEPEHARALIAAHRLVPPADPALAEHWPFPVRIRSLGPFQLEIGGEPLRFEGKPQRKPLELLKLLVALGALGVQHHAVAPAQAARRRRHRRRAGRAHQPEPAALLARHLGAGVAHRRGRAGASDRGRERRRAGPVSRRISGARKQRGVGGAGARTAALALHALRDERSAPARSGRAARGGDPAVPTRPGGRPAGRGLPSRPDERLRRTRPPCASAGGVRALPRGAGEGAGRAAQPRDARAGATPARRLNRCATRAALSVTHFTGRRIGDPSVTAAAGASRRAQSAAAASSGVCTRRPDRHSRPTHLHSPKPSAPIDLCISPRLE